MASDAGSQLVADIRELVGEQIAYRELLLRMTHRDLLLRYKQTVMGFGWAVFMPLINTLIFSVIFTRVAPIHTEVPYPVYAYSGLLIWNAFASSLRFSVTSLTANSSLVTKIYFPREIFPISAVLVAMVDAAVGAVVLVLMMAYYHIAVGPALLLLPVVIAVLAMFTCAMALFLAMANLFYRDVKYLFEIVITVWMFATSVLYPLDNLGRAFALASRLNPMTPIVDSYRTVLLLNRPPTPALLTTGIVTMVVLGVAWLVFHRSESSFAENV